jgi:hypothetical protein
VRSRPREEPEERVASGVRARAGEAAAPMPPEGATAVRAEAAEAAAPMPPEEEEEEAAREAEEWLRPEAEGAVCRSWRPPGDHRESTPARR